MVKHQFLSDIPDEYESACEIPKSQDAKMGEIITRLMEIELRMKDAKENGSLLNANEFAHLAGRKKKKFLCFKCGREGPCAKDCEDESSETSSSEDRKAKKSRRKKAKEKVHFARELDSSSASESEYAERGNGIPRSRDHERMTAWI